MKLSGWLPLLLPVVASPLVAQAPLKLAGTFAGLTDHSRPPEASRGSWNLAGIGVIDRSAAPSIHVTLA